MFESKDTSKKRTINKFARERLDADTGNICFRLRDLIMGFLGEEVTMNSPGFVQLLLARHFRANKLTELARPASKDAVNYGSNVKSELQTTVDGNKLESRPAKVQKVRRGRAERQVQRKEEELKKIRSEKKATGKLFLCRARCPVTRRYCRKVYLSKIGLRLHRK